MTTQSVIKKKVDRLGEVKAALATLRKEEVTLVDHLKELGTGIYSGNLFDANIFTSSRITVDWEAIATEVGYTDRQLKKYSKEGMITYCKVTARLSR
jgi:hypothetical protein